MDITLYKPFEYSMLCNKWFYLLNHSVHFVYHNNQNFPGIIIRTCPTTPRASIISYLKLYGIEKKKKESRLQETSISMLDYNCIHIVPMLTKDIHEISLTRETFMGRRD